MKGGTVRSWIAMSLLGMSTSAAGQATDIPLILEKDVEFRGNVTTSSNAEMVGCFSVSTKPNEPVRLTLKGASFGGSIRLARGALCDQNLLVAETSFRPDEPVSLDVPTNGGRYLILVSRLSGGGRFALLAATLQAADVGQAPTLVSGPEVAPVLAQAGESVESAGNQTPAANPEQPTGNDPLQAARKAMMLAQTDQFNLIKADEAAERARREAEASRQQELARIQAQEQAAWAASERARKQNNTALVLGALAGGLRDGLQQATADRQASFAQMQRNAQIAAQQNARFKAEQQKRSEEAARIAANRQAAQLQLGVAQQQVRQASSAAPSAAPAPATPPRPAQPRQNITVPPASSPVMLPAARQATSTVELISMLEGVVVCPLGSDRAKLFGESVCHGPFQNALSNPGNAADIQLACGSSSSPVRDLGIYGNNRVWGCNYGINPRRSGSPNVDQGQRFGLIIPSRQTYRCDAKIDGYCRGR